MKDILQFDACRPTEMVALIENSGVANARMRAPQMLVPAILAGAFIGFGGAA